MAAMLEWPKDGLVWLQEPGGDFVTLRGPGGDVPIPSDELELFSPVYCERGNCGPAFPSHFGFCPKCGSRLIRRVGMRGVGPNGGSAGTGNLPPLHLAGPRVEVDLPAGRGFALTGMGAVHGLMLLDRIEGALWRRGGSTGNWVRALGGLPPSTGFSRDGWTFAGEETRLVFATDSSLEVVSQVPGGLVRNTFTIEGGCPLGGLAVIDRGKQGAAFAVPVWGAEGLCLAVSPVAGDVRWDLLPVDHATGAPSALGRPVKGVGMFWAGEGGYLSVADGLDPQPVWHPYRPDFRALVSHRPLVTRDGIAYQMGVLDGVAYGFHQLGYFNASTEAIPVDGAVLCAGTLCFKVRHRFTRAPWKPDPVEDFEVPAAHDTFVMPVAALNPDQAIIALVEDTAALGSLASGQNTAPLRAELALLQSGVAPKRLGMIVRIQSLGQLAACVVEGHLWIYDELSNRLCSWRLA